MYWIASPCKDCQKRYRACHDTCVEFRDYRDRYEAEQKKIKQEKAIKNMVNQLNYGSTRRKENLPEQLKHGRRPRH